MNSLSSSLAKNFCCSLLLIYLQGQALHTNKPFQLIILFPLLHVPYNQLRITHVQQPGSTFYFIIIIENQWIRYVSYMHKYFRVTSISMGYLISLYQEFHHHIGLKMAGYVFVGVHVCMCVHMCVGVQECAGSEST